MEIPETFYKLVRFRKSCIWENTPSIVHGTFSLLDSGPSANIAWSLPVCSFLRPRHSRNCKRVFESFWQCLTWTLLSKSCWIGVIRASSFPGLLFFKKLHLFCCRRGLPLSDLFREQSSQLCNVLGPIVLVFPYREEQKRLADWSVKFWHIAFHSWFFDWAYR